MTPYATMTMYKSTVVSAARNTNNTVTILKRMRNVASSMPSSLSMPSTASSSSSSASLSSSSRVLTSWSFCHDVPPVRKHFAVRHFSTSTTTTVVRPRSWTFPTLSTDPYHTECGSHRPHQEGSGGPTTSTTTAASTISSTFLLERAVLHGNRPFVKDWRGPSEDGTRNSKGNGDVNGNETLSYRDVLMRTQRIKEELISMTEKGSSSSSSSSLRPRFVAHSSLPGSEYIATQWACFASPSHVSVPLATSHKVPELQHILEDTDPSVIVVSSGSLAAPNRVHVLEAAASLGMADRVVEIEPPQTTTMPAADHAAELDVDYLLHDGRRPMATASAAPQPALLVYTSGTTGRPKGVLHTNHTLFHQITDLVAAWEWNHTDVAQHMLPLHHIHGIVNVLGCATYIGAQVHFTVFDAVQLWNEWSGLTPQAGQGNGQPADDDASVTIPNVLMAVPTIYAKLLEATREGGPVDPATVQAAVRRTLAPMRLQVSGSAALPISVMEEWEKLTGQTLLERYGMTEFAMALSNPYRQYREDGHEKALYPPSSLSSTKQKRIPGHVGLPLPSVQVRIVDETDRDKILVQANGNDDIVMLTTTPPTVDDGEVVVANTSGALQVKGPTVFDGYWNRPDATAEAFTNDGWFDTGDTAEYDSELDSFRILGRSSVDILKVGGYKISALEIERHLLDHPDLREVVVVGLDDDIWGQRVAVIARQDPCHARIIHPVTLKELQDWCESRLARYKIPTRLLLVDDIPKNAMGKVNKKELVKLFKKE